jgi:shikimate dehydrogenase
VTTTAKTRLVCLLGHPIAHSVSPQIHSAAFGATGVDGTYVAFDVPGEELAVALAGLRALGILGANVTVPHKRAVWDLVEERTREAEHVGAINTLFWDGHRLAGDNTDALGLGDVLTDDLNLQPGDDVVLVGAGGAARAAAVALGRVGARVEVVARREEAAVDVAALARRFGAEVGPAANPRLVVNATPLGLHGEALPERFMTLRRGQIALDLVYGREPTPFQRAALAAGATAVDGTGMLVAQAARSFERWTGVAAPRLEMARAARAALGR